MDTKEKKRLEKEFGSYGYEVAFKSHFGISYKDCNKEMYQRLLLQVERDSKLNDLIQ